MSAPVVTGVSPIEGPFGTKVTIRGENLGLNDKDLIGLTIGGVDCLVGAEWESPKKIIAISRLCKGWGDIIVTTKSGRSGTSTVQFQGKSEGMKPETVTSIWIDDSDIPNMFWSRGRPLSPSAYQPEDPLGLCMEENVSKFPEEKLREYFPEGSGDIRMENFVAAWFLLENHHSTSFADLKNAMGSLDRKVNAQKEGQMSFYKRNMGSVINQLDTLIVLKDSFEAYKEQHGGDPVRKVENTVLASKREADKLFDDILKRKDRADATRNCLNVLQRYKFLFSLPTSIERNIQKGDYDIVINDYARAKSLLENLDLPVFKKVYAEVEQRISGLREILCNKLQDMPAPLDDQKRIIWNLVNLDTPGDKAWECIICQYDYMEDVLANCYDEHASADSATETPENTPTRIVQARNTSLNTSYLSSSSSTHLLGHQHDQGSVPQRVLFVEESTELLSESFPDLWKLGQAYFTQELHSKVDFSKQPVFKKMVLQMAQLYAGLVRAAIFPHTGDNPIFMNEKIAKWPNKRSENITAWLTQCLRLVRLAYASLIDLDLPGEVLDIVRDLIFDIRFHSMSALFLKAAEDIRLLHKHENWDIRIDDTYGGITQLPSLFEGCVQDTIQLVKVAVMHSERREADLLDRNSVKTELTTLIRSMLVSFASALELLSVPAKSPDKQLLFADNQRVTSPMASERSRANANDSVVENSPPSSRLLVLLGNCNYTVEHLLPRLQETFQKLDYPDVSGPLKTAKETLLEVDDKLFQAFLDLRSQPVVGSIEPNMYSGGFDWISCNEPLGVKSYVQHALLHMTNIHAEVVSVVPPYAARVVAEIGEAVVEELVRLFSCKSQYNRWGILQARLDLAAFERAIQAFITPKASSLFEEARHLIPTLEQFSDKKRLNDLLSTFEAKMQFQLRCFEGSVITSKATRPMVRETHLLI